MNKLNHYKEVVLLSNTNIPKLILLWGQPTDKHRETVPTHLTALLVEIKGIIATHRGQGGTAL